MKMQEIASIARSRGIKPGRRNKTELIRFIQAREGNFDCFGKATQGFCDRHDCLWRADCLRKPAMH